LAYIYRKVKGVEIMKIREILEKFEYVAWKHGMNGYNDEKTQNKIITEAEQEILAEIERVVDECTAYDESDRHDEGIAGKNKMILKEELKQKLGAKGERG
jgi:hypothetical protein